MYHYYYSIICIISDNITISMFFICMIIFGFSEQRAIVRLNATHCSIIQDSPVQTARRDV